MGLRFLSRASDGAIVLASRHPRGCSTWHWSILLKRNAIVSNEWRPWYRAERRCNQWHDFYRLPWGWWLIVSQQDFHKQVAA